MRVRARGKRHAILNGRKNAMVFESRWEMQKTEKLSLKMTNSKGKGDVGHTHSPNDPVEVELKCRGLYGVCFCPSSPYCRILIND